ncbi:MFS transporter [Mollisia scopiformis]|uniref:MFS transporter n=1 Tax=Mollisia scopiformis TaxID=149040 RepID=A0A194XG35_MOLSC|nr:MFS transporter [Mollisia scopiformis]KUJ19089.1 MFS transporter [Mollisia scopiformis]
MEQKKLEEAAQELQEPPYTIFSERYKVFTVIIASFAALISPISASIYYPALDPLAADLHVKVSTINLTITVYMIFQGLAPTFIGSISDKNGRRPAYLICFFLYLCANIGLALQTSYPALVCLRCLQSAGSSGTVALASGTAADLVTRAERGKYIGYASMGVALGPALGPVIGGLLTHFLGWRSIFWFLTILCGIMLLIMVIAFPETSRSVVGNGSIPPQKWNVPLIRLIQQRLERSSHQEIDTQTITHRYRRPNPLEALSLALQKETGMLLTFSALMYAGYFGVLSSLPSQLARKYDFNSLQIGLCFIPYGFGSVTSRWTVGTLTDRNFRRHAKKLGIAIVKNRQQRLQDFPIETARLEIALPMVYLSCICVMTFGWVMEHQTNLAGPLITLFFTGNMVTGSFSAINTLVVDINVKTPATATAASNLFRCLFGAGAVAAAVPLIERIGMGWMGTFIAALWLVLSPMLWCVWFYGRGWRDEKAAKDDQREKERMEREKGNDVEKVVNVAQPMNAKGEWSSTVQLSGSAQSSASKEGK